jgi:hypothetical protein
MLLPHANTDARADFIARDGGRGKLSPAHAGVQFGNSARGRKRHRADVQHTLPVHIVAFEILYQRAIDESSMRRR